MGLIITSEIATSVGMTSEAYLNIDSVSYKKSRGSLVRPDMDTDTLTVKVNLYPNQDDRLNSPAKRTISADIPKHFGFSDQGSPSPMSELKGAANMFEVAYAQIKQYLESKGLTVVDEL